MSQVDKKNLSVFYLSNSTGKPSILPIIYLQYHIRAKKKPPESLKFQRFLVVTLPGLEPGLSP